MKHTIPTLKVAPWDLPPVTEADLIGEALHNSVGNDVDGLWKDRPGAIVKPFESKAVANLVGRTFMGPLNASDLDYMSKAILQMWDENRELRERVRRLEERLGL